MKESLKMSHVINAFEQQRKEVENTLWNKPSRNKKKGA